MRKITTLALFIAFFNSASAQIPFNRSIEVSGTAFGHSLDVYQNTAIVATASYFLPFVTAPQVCVFDYTESGIVQTQVLSQPDGVISDGYGDSVSISDGLIAIGARSNEPISAVYTYKKNGVTWEFLEKIVPPVATQQDFFTSVELYGNWLFISAHQFDAGQLNILPQSGSVYIYHYNGAGWDYSQTISVSGTEYFGTTKKAYNNRLFVTSEGLSDSQIFHMFILNGNTWEFESTSPVYGDLENQTYDYAISDDQMFMLNFNMGIQTVKVINYLDNWSSAQSVSIDQTDQIYTEIEVSGDRMFLGSSWYILQMTRNFPVLYYAKVGANWQYVTSFHSEANNSQDDHFGEIMAIHNNNLIIGSSQEGVPLFNGKAYWLDVNSLSNPNFENQKLALYPNPAKDKLLFSGDKLDELREVEVLSTRGQLLLSQKGHSDFISLDGLSGGLYFVRMHFADGAQQTAKIIKQ